MSAASPPGPPTPTSTTRSPRVIQIVFWLVLLAFVSWALFGLVKPFLLPVVWAVTLAIIFHPLYRKIRDRMPNKEGVAATLTTVVIFLSVLLPVAGVVGAMVNEGFAIYEKVDSGQYDLEGMLNRAQSRVPLVQDFLRERGVDPAEVQSRVTSAATQLGQRAVTYVTNALSNVAGLVVSFFVMLYLIYFFLKDGYRIIGKIIEALPLGDEHEWRMISRFGSTARATIKGSVVVGLVQGTIGGIAFALLGIHGAVFWGVLMAVASLIPSVGSALIWGPAAIYLLATGDVTKGVILIVVGGGVIGMVDNFLRPLLVGRESGVPDWIVLLVSFGGIAAFGLSGLVIGPVMAALFLTVWEQFSVEFNVQEDLVAAVLQTVRKNEQDAENGSGGHDPDGKTHLEAMGIATDIADPVGRADAPTTDVALDPKEQERVDNEKASVAMHVVIADDAREEAAGNALRAQVAADTAVTSAAERDAARTAEAADSASDAAENAADNAHTAADAAATVQMSAEFIRQKIEGDVSAQAQVVVKAAAEEAETSAQSAAASAETAQGALATVSAAPADEAAPPQTVPPDPEAPEATPTAAPGVPPPPAPGA